MNDLTWTCHVCKDERPDDRISVFKSTAMLEGGIQVQQNVRYCNDRPDCGAKAPDVDFFGGK